ncbi:hypothetical protein MMC07_000389 [Pseudocyphellaria aurata]|nr:hypothetical protein [Pseudocyphellaria aurata]
MACTVEVASGIHVCHTQTFVEGMCLPARRLLEAYDPSHDAEEVSKLLEALLHKERAIAGKINILLAAVQTMLERKMWQAAALFLTRNVPGRDPM